MDLSALSPYYIVGLPIVVSFIAGILRQDKAPKPVNEGITLGVVFILAGVQALLDGKLGGSTLADFAIIAGYAVAMAHTPPLADLQQYLQSNWFSLGKPATAATPPTAATTGMVQPAQPIIHIDVPSLAQQLLGQLNLQQLAVLLRDELIKASQPVSQQPTSPMPVAQPVRANTPPASWQGQPPRAG